MQTKSNKFRSTRARISNFKFVVQYRYGIIVLTALVSYLVASDLILRRISSQSDGQPAALDYTDIDIRHFHKSKIRDCTIPFGQRNHSISPVAAQNTVTGVSSHQMVLTIKSIYNEEDIILENLFWYLDQGFRRYLMLDTGSQDRTIDIITNFRQDYAHIAEVVLIFFRKFSREITLFESMMFQFSTYLWPDAPWIFVVDADEFVVSNNGLLQDFSSIPKGKDAIRCHADQYCLLQNQTTDNNSKFYRNLQHLHNGSFKKKCIGRPNFYYRIDAGHHAFRMLNDEQCANEFLEHNLKTHKQTKMATTNCQAYYKRLYVGSNNECRLQGLSLVNLPENSSMFQRNVQLQNAFEDLPEILSSQTNVQSYAQAAQNIYSMYQTYASTEKCTLNMENVEQELYQVFFPPITRPIYYFLSAVTSQELQHQFCQFMRDYIINENDMALVILHTDPTIDLSNSIKWHFSLGFRRFFIVSTFQYDTSERGVIDEVSTELGRHASFANIELQGYYNYSTGELLEVINQFVVYSQIWSVKSLLSFFILDNQIIFSEKSAFQSISNANMWSGCQVYSTKVTDCAVKSNRSALNQNYSCVDLRQINSRQGLRYNRFHLLQVQFSQASYQNQSQSKYFSIESNMTKYINILRQYPYTKNINYADCNKHNISFREYPLRSKRQFVKKFSTGGSRKYRHFRSQIKEYNGDEEDVYGYIYSAISAANESGIYDPLPIDRAIQNSKKLLKKKSTWIFKRQS